MKIKVISINDKSPENSTELSDKIFSVKPSKQIIKNIIDWQLNRFKFRTAKTKQSLSKTTENLANTNKTKESKN